MDPLVVLWLGIIGAVWLATGIVIGLGFGLLTVAVALLACAAITAGIAVCLTFELRLGSEQ